MATESLVPYFSNDDSLPFLLAQTSATKTVWINSGRPISAPFSVTVERKLTNGNSPSNDHVILRVVHVQVNPATGKPATFQASLDLSIPKDQSVLTPQICGEGAAIIASLLNDCSVMGATSANRTKLIEGRDL